MIADLMHYSSRVAAAFLRWSCTRAPGLTVAGCMLIYAGLDTPTTRGVEPAAEAVVVSVNLLELPSSRQAQLILQSDAGFFWDQTPLINGLGELSQTHRISVWIDRQLDPMQLVTTPAVVNGKTSLHARLRQLATAVGGEMGLIENVVYFGPPGRVAALQRAAVELHDTISRSVQTRTVQLRLWRWDDISNTTEMLAQLSAEWKIQVTAELPHDLYHAGELLEPCTLATQLSLLAGGFDLEAEAAGANQFRLRPLAQREVWQANYRSDDLDLRSLSRLKEQFVDSQCQTRGAVSTVRGVTEFHLALLASPAKRAGVGRPESSARWGFEVQNTPVSAVLDKLAGSMGFSVHWDVSSTAEMRAQLISFTVSGATTDELLAEVARVSGLRISRDKDQVSIGP